MARMPSLIAAALAVLFVASACNRQAPQDTLKSAIDAGKQQSEEQAATDPRRRPHPGDRNPLRRKLGDLQIRELFFGPDQTDGDWMAWLPCSQAHAGLPVDRTNRIYLKRCDALSGYLVAKAHKAGFHDASADDVMDPRISGAQKAP